MANEIENEFNRLGFKIGDTIEVVLIGAKSEKAIFTITNDVINSGHFPIKLTSGEIANCHLDHIDKAKMRLVNRGGFPFY